MRKLKNSYKILSLLLLGSFLISLLILFDISNMTTPTQAQKSITRDNFTIEQKSPFQEDNPPKPSAPDSASIYNQTFNIAQSEDDAFLRLLPEPSGTFCDTTNITLGAADINSVNLLYTQMLALRWNITVPKYATITKAYINLTIANLTFFGVSWTGFNTSISAFNEPSTNDFSKPEEFLPFRAQTSQIPWELNGTEVIDQTIQTTNIADLLQQVMVFDEWEGIFGIIMIAGVGTQDNETIQFWAYDSGNPEYYPKLFVEWKNTPRFIETPEDIYVIEKHTGYSLKWQIGDNNPYKFKITCNVPILGIPYIDFWEAGEVTYDLPSLDRGFYNFTAYFNDTDGNLVWDSVIVEAGKPMWTYKISRSEDDAWYKPEEGAAFTHTGALQLGGSHNEKDKTQRVICLRFKTAVPKHARIKRAYVNLTISGKSNYDGFTSQIKLFYPPVADFSDDYDNDVFTLVEKGGQFDIDMLWYRPVSDLSVDLVLDGTEVVNDIIQTPELNSSLQESVDFAGYNGYIGLYIIPTDNVNSILNEKLNTYSSNALTQYKPTLYVEWEETPYFVETPADFSAKNGIHGYHLDWTPADDNPTTFSITCNDTVSNISPGSTIYSGVWQSGIKNSYNLIHMEKDTSITKIRYDLPPLEIGVYNFTIRINDADSWYNLDSVLVNVTDLDLPVLSEIKFIQNGKEVNYFQCGNGDFKLRIYNSSSITPILRLDAYYPEYNQRIYSDALNWPLDVSSWQRFPVDVFITGDTESAKIYDESDPEFDYNSDLGCYEFISSSDTYVWTLWKWTTPFGYNPGLKLDKSTPINAIKYNVLNRFEIRIDGDGQYIYNQTIYGGDWGRPLEIWNRDLTSPIYSEPEFIEPDDPDKHYEINIWAGTEAYGAGIESVILYYSVDDSPWEEWKMVLYDGKYYGEIPAQEEGATIDYYIKITDIAGNSIKTDIYHEKAPIFEEPSIIIPIVGILLGILGSLSIVMIYHHKRKVALKKLTSEKKIKKVKK